jgi:hypothetical protein
MEGLKMINVITETAVQVLASLAVTLIGVFGSWLLAKLAKRAELAGIQSATDELITAAQITVMELQQTVVEHLKAAAADGKLTEDEINGLGVMLLNGAKEKMSAPSMKLLIAAGADVDKIIKGAGEALIAEMHE